MSTKIEIQNLYKIFGPRPEKYLSLAKTDISKDDMFAKTKHAIGLRDINLKIMKSEVFMVIGLSGSGKSTLIRHINRLHDATSGKILIDDQNILDYSRPELLNLRSHKVSMVFQKFGLLPHKTVLENVSYGLKIQKVDKAERRDRALDWIEQVGLQGYESVYPSKLSGGMQQRVGIARALAVNPEILLLDEPFSALDPMIRKEMRGILVALQNKLKKTIVFITHDMQEALSLGDRVTILKDGEVIQTGTPDEIVNNPVDDYVREFIESSKE